MLCEGRQESRLAPLFSSENRAAGGKIVLLQQRRIGSVRHELMHGIGDRRLHGRIAFTNGDADRGIFRERRTGNFINAGARGDQFESARRRIIFDIGAMLTERQGGVLPGRQRQHLWRGLSGLLAVDDVFAGIGLFDRTQGHGDTMAADIGAGMDVKRIPFGDYDRVTDLHIGNEINNSGAGRIHIHRAVNDIHALALKGRNQAAEIDIQRCRRKAHFLGDGIAEIDIETGELAIVLVFEGRETRCRAVGEPTGRNESGVRFRCNQRNGQKDGREQERTLEHTGLLILFHDEARCWCGASVPAPVLYCAICHRLYNVSMTNFSLAEVHPRHAQLVRRFIDLALAQGWPVGQRVTELELADQLQVSRTPVRVMLGLLRDMGVLEALPNRGQVLALTEEELRALVLPDAPAADAALHAALIRDRLDGKLEEEPSQADIARRYKVSAATVQRLFQRLEQEGLVQRTGWRWSFLPFLSTAESQRASYQIRSILEPSALLLPEFKANESALRQILADHQHLLETLPEKVQSPTWIFNLDARFHETLVNFSQNPFILNVIRQQNALRRLLEIRSYSDQTRVKAWVKEHVAIANALMDGEQAKASQLLASHLRKADRFLGGLSIRTAKEGKG